MSRKVLLTHHSTKILLIPYPNNDLFFVKAIKMRLTICIWQPRTKYLNNQICI